MKSHSGGQGADKGQQKPSHAAYAAEAKAVWTVQRKRERESARVIRRERVRDLGINFIT